MVEYFTDDELMALPTGSVMVYDVESYPNYFCVTFRDIVLNKHVAFEMYEFESLSLDKLRWLIWRYCLVGFYSNNYDLLMLTYATYGKSAAELNQLSAKLVSKFEPLRPYQFERDYGIRLPLLNHVDLFEVAPLDGSLKLYGGRLHTKYMQDLPYPPHSELTREQSKKVLEYNANDLEHTYLLLKELAPHIELRQELGRTYGRDMRSLSDAQVAEAIICTELHKLTGWYPRRPRDPVSVASYKPPACMKFQTRMMQDALARISACTFQIVNGKAVMPKELADFHVRIGTTVYKLGMGGLHSQEKSASYKSGNGMLLIDRDVASYYPFIVINQGLYPSHLGPAFLDVYKTIVNRRLDAKKAGNKKISEGLKIAINGIFGKFGNEYSAVYSPDLMLQVTLSGQLFLLMLIEMLELAGIQVVSGNTDGAVIYCHESRYDDLLAIVAMWEAQTNFVTEETRYSAIYSRDVNNYFAVKDLSKESEADKAKRAKAAFFSERMGIKTKGVYSEFGSAHNSVLSKNPEFLVCIDAVIQMLHDRTAIEDTIHNCKDIRRFIALKNVKTGAMKDDEYLGRVVRWYYGRGQSTAIHYRGSGNKVGKSAGSKTLMMLPDSLPADIDYDTYINMSEEMLFDIAFYHRQESASLF